MNQSIIIHAMTTVIACGGLLADEPKKEVVKIENKHAIAVADAKADARGGSSIATTNLNGRPTTIIEDQDAQGRKRIRTITNIGGKTVVKDVTPKEKEPVKKEDAFAKFFTKKAPEGDKP